MNCKEAHLLIASLTGDERPDLLVEHVRDCPACADLLAADARLRATLRSPEHLGSAEHVPSAYVLGRIRQEIATPVRRSWIESLKGNPLMKIALPATALVALALIALPRPVDAATPLATFAKMKKAVLAKAKQTTLLEFKLGKKTDGSLGTWIVLDGELTEVPLNGNFHTNKDGKDIRVQTRVATDTSDLSPEMKKLVDKAIQDALKNGTDGGMTHVGTSYSVNGKSVDAATAQKLLHDNGLDFKISVDLDEADYQSIAFGTDRNHLVLNPKKTQNRRYVVTLDPKSNLPQNVLLERNVKGKWVAAKRSTVNLL